MMKTVVIQIILFISLLAGKGMAQISTYDLDFPGLIFTNILRSNDTLVVSGIITRGDGFPNQSLALMKFDTSGILLDYNVYRDSLGSDFLIGINGKPHGLWRTDQGECLILNHIGGRGGMLIKTSNSGEELWRREYLEPNALTKQFTYIVALHDAYYICGHKRKSNNKVVIFIIKTDKSGNKIWEKQYEENDDVSVFLHDILLDNGQIVLAGATSLGDVPVEEKKFVNKIFAVDTSGSVLWSWQSEPSLHQGVRGLVKDGAVGWSYITLFLDYTGQSQFTVSSKYERRDTQFNLVTENYLDDADAFYNFMIDMIPLADNGYLAVGINYEDDEPYAHAYASMVKLNMSGEIVWDRLDLALPQVEHPTLQYLNSAIELPSGNIVAAGYYLTPSDPKEYGILIKVNADGCIDTLCTTTSVIQQIVKSEEPGVILFPNPATDQITIDPRGARISKLEIFDLTGKRILRHQLQRGIANTISLKSYQVPSGLYVWRVLDGGGRTYSQGKIAIVD